MHRKIVVGFDGSAGAQDAAALGVALAQRTGAALTFVCAFYDVPDPLPDPLRGRLRERAEEVLREAARQVPDSVAASTRLVSQRSPARALFEFTERSGCDLMVLGSSRDAAEGRVACGRLGARVVTGAPCAVAIAPAGLRSREPWSPRLIGVGVNGGPESERALGAAAGLARTFGARIRLMAVIEHAQAVSLWGVPYPIEAQDALRAQAEQVLAQAARELPEDLEAQTALLDGHPIGQALAADAAEAGVDALVVGSRAYGPLRRVLLGSVSGELLRQAPCPLVVVPRGARDAGGAPGEAVDAAEALR